MTPRSALMIRARASWAISYTPPMWLRSTSSGPRRTPFCAARLLFFLGLGRLQMGRVTALLGFSRCWRPCAPACGGSNPSPPPSCGPWASTFAPPCRLGTPRRDRKPWPLGPPISSRWPSRSMAWVSRYTHCHTTGHGCGSIFMLTSTCHAHALHTSSSAGRGGPCWRLGSPLGALVRTACAGAVLPNSHGVL